MDENNTNKIIEMLTKEGNFKAAFTIANNFYTVKCQIRKMFVGRIINLAKNYGFELWEECSNVEGFINMNRKYSYIRFGRRTTSQRWAIFLRFYTMSEGSDFGMDQAIQPKKKACLEANQLSPIWQQEKEAVYYQPTEEEPYGWKDFPGSYRWWDCFETLQDMLRGEKSELLAYIREEIFEKVKDFDKLVAPLPQ